MSDFDTIPVRLPSGGTAIVQLPKVFTDKDAAHMSRLLAHYTEEAVARDNSPVGAQQEITK